jgi:transcription elongation GreA/GreB family factor
VRKAPRSSDTVRFGSTVVVARSDGREQTYRIVGIDEANPARGTLSQISPLARALMARTVGDTVAIGDIRLEIVDIR